MEEERKRTDREAELIRLEREEADLLSRLKLAQVSIDQNDSFCVEKNPRAG